MKKYKGSNYEYWTEKHDRLLQNGWDLFLIIKTPSRQWGKIFKRHSTSSKEHANKFVDKLRNEGNYARIVCGYDKNSQRVKMYSIIFKPKKRYRVETLK